LITLGERLTIAQVAAVAAGAEVVLGEDARARMTANHADFVAMGSPDVLEMKEAWLTGPRAGEASPWERLVAFVRGHCAGVGAPLPVPAVRAMLACRAQVLAHGLSGCRPEAAEQLVAMLQAGVHPVVPSQGSVGAAGDLAPLAHAARVAFRLGGQAVRDGRLLDSDAAMEGLPEFRPEPKEALSVINGATLTVALAALACHQARGLLRTAEVGLAMSMEVVRANTGMVRFEVLQSRGHGGGVRVGRRLRELLSESTLASVDRRPDAFSIRCAPAVLGSAWDALSHIEEVVERELNGACDNPLVIARELVDGGNFHGAPVALAMDHLKTALTQVASIAERRIFRMTYGVLTGLPSFLVESTGLNSGFMLAQYTAASLVSECKGLSMPASVDAIPTGQHHEDHVSMGPIAARGALRICDALAEVLAIEILVAAQGLEFRMEEAPLAPRVEALRARVREVVPRWREDRVLHLDQQAVAAGVRAGRYED